jgi:dCTP deaminase
MILPYQELMKRGLNGDLLYPFDPSLVNPASIDIRIGKEIRVYSEIEGWQTLDLANLQTYTMRPHEFILASTYERLKVPLDCAMDLRLKSTRARQGFDHALAFWFDPGWDGIGTMELVNNAPYLLKVHYQMLIGQIIYHRLMEPCEKPYTGRYQGASSVEGAKV